MEDYIIDYLNVLNNLEQTRLTADVDILTGASQDFLEEVAKLESMTDFRERGKEAERYINKSNSITFINYLDLIAYLLNPDSCSQSTWQQLYLLERSIPPRKGTGTTPSWFDRLKIFADTYKLEHAVVGKKLLGLPGKIYFAKRSGDHENLHLGSGEYWPDFYCWDNTNNKCCGFVEFKHWASTDLQKAVAFYKDKHYKARYVLLLLKDHYYLIDYLDSEAPIIIEQLDLEVPELLYW